MIALTAREVAAACAVETAAEGVVTGLSVDSRLVRPGDLFVALSGARTDGARFSAAARRAGAALVLTEHPGNAATEIGVPDALIALGQVAAEVRRRSQAVVVGITGSTGKTSTRDILAALLAHDRPTVKSPANYNTEVGLPLTLGLIEPDTQAVVCELAMRGMGQIAYLAEICRPDAALITNIGAAHLEQMGTLEAVAEAKAEIIPAVGPGGVVVVPFGELLLEPYLDMTRARVITFGEQDGADVRLTAFAGRQAEFELSGRTLQVPVNFTQRHNALNLAAALAVCDGLGLPLDSLVGGALEVSLSQWRGETIELEGGGILIADCYNANPASMEAGLRHLAESAAGRRAVAVIGDMAELGPTAPQFHARVGELAAELGIEVVATGELARGYGGTWFSSVDALVEALPGLLRTEDAVLVKASRSVGLERVVEALVA